MQNKMLSTLHTLHNGGRGGNGPEQGYAVSLAPAFVQHADFNALYFTDSGF